ncbi:MAG: tryptophanyl-tRNA synthetase [Gemmatimonas sp. SG8_17]|nr:MAG: tryptophanyl-tRNA synthetase [Gemmatimonas sp. SG8_17]
MRRVFSGIQPSGELHIGNYLGAVQNWVQMQQEYQCVFCIVDYHAVTQDYDQAVLSTRTFDMAVSLIAAGIDPERAIMFVQSHVPEHTELSWVFTTVTPIGELERMTQFKDKSRRHESVLAGLLNYPILQAADVLLYKAELVPVGEDQVQHVELMREIARKWNGRYDEGYFPEPQAVITEARRIVGLDGQAKMSKSLDNTIGIMEGPDGIWDRLRPAVTDPARVKRTDPGTPEVCNIYSLHRHFSSPDVVTEVADKCRSAAWGCLDCKRVLVESITGAFADMRERAAELKADPGQVHEILRAGAERARGIAVQTMSGVRERMGLMPGKLGAEQVR